MSHSEHVGLQGLVYLHPALWPVLGIQTVPGASATSQPSLPSISEEAGGDAESNEPKSKQLGDACAEDAEPGKHELPRAKALNAAAASALLLQLGRQPQKACAGTESFDPVLTIIKTTPQ